MDIIKVLGDNLKKYRTAELNILNSIIGSKNIKEDFEKLGSAIFGVIERYKCKNYNKTFIAKTNIVKKHCFISNNVKYGVALKASKKISEKDLASDFNISHNTVNRIINSFFEKYKVNYKHLPEVLCFDEFKSTKDADGAMSFIYCDAKNHKIIDIVENRQLKYLKKYFSRYPKNVRNKVKHIVMDMYKPYISLVKEIFPQAKIIIDKFYIVNNLSIALNKAIKRISFGYRSFFNFRNRILIMDDLVNIKNGNV